MTVPIWSASRLRSGSTPDSGTAFTLHPEPTAALRSLRRDDPIGKGEGRTLEGCEGRSGPWESSPFLKRSDLVIRVQELPLLGAENSRTSRVCVLRGSVPPPDGPSIDLKK